MKDIFKGLPFGFSAFDDVKDSLLPCRASKRLPAGAKTVISVLFPYYLGEDIYKGSNISRYAVSADYHLITSKILGEISAELAKRYPNFVFEPFVDSSPLPEVRCAVAAGLGCLGKNSLFISEEYGSWVFIGEIVTDLYIEPFSGEKKSCLLCGECARKCPMGAIKENGVDREMCLSGLSQKKGELSKKVKEKMTEYNCAWGCDICQKVCPMNKNVRLSPIKEFFDTAQPIVDENVSIVERAFAWRGSAVIERNLKAINENRLELRASSRIKQTGESHKNKEE